MFEKIKNLQWYYHLVMLVCVAALIEGSVYYFVTGETRVEIAKLNDEIAQLQTKNQNARIATEHINEFRALFASKMEEYEELKVLLPEQREITNVLQGLQNTANESRMIVMRFVPRDDKSEENSIMSKPVEVEVDSNFTNLRAFYDRIAKLPRIVSVTDFKINQLDKQIGNKTLHAQFLLTAYYAAPADLSAKPAPGAPGQPAAPGAAPAGKPAAPAAPAPAQPAAK